MEGEETVSDSPEAANLTPFQQKWGEALNDGFVLIPAALLRHQNKLELDCGETLVLINLLMAWWKPGDMPFPRTSVLAKRMQVSTRTVQRHIENLEKKELIRRVWQKFETQKGSARRFAKYDLSGIVERLKELGQIPHPARKLGATSRQAATSIGNGL